MSIRGKVGEIKIRLDGSISSQFLTGMLLALPGAGKDVQILVDNPKSTAYIDLTLDILKMFDVRVEHDDYKLFRIKGGQKYCGPEEPIKPEGDYSGAAFLLVAGAVGGDVQIDGLQRDSKQGDKKIIEVIKGCGAIVKVDENSVRVSRKKLLPFNFNAENCPDLFPPLAVLASFCEGVSEIKGVNRLKDKETDRENALMENFKKMNVKIGVKNDTMFIKGGVKRACKINSFNDHRIAMTGAIASIGLKEGILINGSQAVSKSYVNFFKDIVKLGGWVK
jgi:3-phosphoshikimate 1-carboxyvinyltransferase